jgi:hypothetical protein
VSIHVVPVGSLTRFVGPGAKPELMERWSRYFARRTSSSAAAQVSVALPIPPTIAGAPGAVGGVVSGGGTGWFMSTAISEPLNGRS